MMNRLLLVSICALLVNVVYSQKDDLLEKHNKEVRYGTKKGFRGPDYWHADFSPYDNQNESENDGTSSYLDDVYDEEEIQYDRKTRYGEDYGNGGLKRPKSTFVPAEKIEFPEFEQDEEEEVTEYLDDQSVGKVGNVVSSEGFWDAVRVILIFILVLVVMLVIYLFVRNMKPVDRRVNVDVQDDWDPTVMTKSELELLLEDAIDAADYRSCVRIHFTYILKELIDTNTIVWKPEKTNNDYLREVRNKRGYDDFQECVRIYDLVWYGDYQIGLAEYEQLRPTLEGYLDKINNGNEQ